MLSVPCVRRRRIAFIAALSLLCAQAIGLAHALAHPQAKGFVAVSASPRDAYSAFDAQHDEGTWRCQLFDQSSHADGATPSQHALVFAAPAKALAAAPAAPVHATCACGYHARGPPTFPA